MRTLGFLHRPRSASALYGVVEAERGLLRAIVEHSLWDRVIIWADGEADIPADPRTEIRPVSKIGDDVRAGVTALHQVGLGPHSVAALRGDIPIPVYTSVYAALSYNEQLPRHVIERLVRKTDLDTNIYPSSCSAEAVGRIHRTLSNLNVPENGVVHTRVVPVGVDTDRFTPASQAEKRSIRRSLGLPENRILATVLTRFSPSDKADLVPLIRSLLTIDAGDTELLFVFAGSDAYPGAKAYLAVLRSEIEQLGLGARARIVSARARDEVVALLRCSDIFVSPADSVQETFGIAPVEAMACGLPAVVSDWNGYRETVIDGVTGFLAPTTMFNTGSLGDDLAIASDYRRQHLLLAQSVAVDTDAIVEGCQALARDPGRLTRMGVAARARAVHNYGWPAVIASYERVWSDRLVATFQSDARGPVGLDHFATFGHYASTHASDRDRFQSTELGRRARAGQYKLQIYSEMRDLVTAALVGDVLDRTTTPAMLINLVEAIDGRDPSSVRFCIAWMVKHSLLRRCGPTGR